MKILALSTAHSFTAIALIDGAAEKVIFEETWASQNDEAEKLMPEIQKLLDKSKITFQDLDKIIVVRGPGSFTGLRIGVTVANTISHLLACELNSITTFEFWHHISELPVLVFAGKGAVYLSMPGEKEGELIDLPEINAVLKEKNIEKYFGDITLVQKAEITEAQFEDSNFSFGQTMLKAAAEKLPAEKIVSPLYIKAPSISKSKKQSCFT